MATTLLDRSDKWSFTVRLFHWSSFVLLVCTWLLVLVHQRTEDNDDFFINWHQSLGIVLFFWVIARLVGRWVSQVPSPSNSNSILMDYSAKTVHVLLYMALLVMPITGFLMTQFGEHAVHLFNRFDLPLWLETDRALKGTMHKLHTLFVWTTLWLMTLAHVGAVLYHQLIKKDSLLSRML